MMINKFITKLSLYILPVILAFILIGNYLKYDNNDNKEIILNNLSISEKLMAEMTIKLKNDNYKLKTFKKSLIRFFTFSSIKDYRQINYAKKLHDKYLDSTYDLKKEQLNIIELYKDYYIYKNENENNFKILILRYLGFFTSIAIMMGILFLIKKIKNKRFSKPLRYYVYLFFLLNYGFSYAYSINQDSLKNALFNKADRLPYIYERHFEKKRNNENLENDTYRKSDFIKDGWYTVNINNEAKIDLPTTLEIQKGKYKVFKNNLAEILELNTSYFVAQNIGVNDFSNKGKERYARVMFDTDVQSIGDYEFLDFNIKEIEQNVVDDLGNLYKDMIVNQFSKYKEGKLLKWKIPILKNLNNMSCLHLSYERKLKNLPIVLVNTYIFYNNDRVHTFTLSYRKKESNYWEKDFNNILNSLEINKID